MKKHQQSTSKIANAGFRVGELIENRYRVLSVIASGGMGTVYQVSDEARQGETVALKVLHWDIPNDEIAESVERFQQEFHILTQLQHPNLVKVYNYGISSQGELYFTMELIREQDLKAWMNQSSPETSISVIVQICRALAYIHARGVIHGDLKPANVLLCDDQVKIVDFGVALDARASEGLTRYYTPDYAAPEIKRRGVVDHRADLYSLGVIWYEWLVGEPPYFLFGAPSLIPFILNKILKTYEYIPVTLGPVITRLLATYPTDRYNRANEVIEMINEVTDSAYALETRETASSYALRGRFVGREQEMHILQDNWKQALKGTGKMVLVGGESGVGKTRLVEEFTVQAELDGIHVVRGQCLEGGSAAYRPWREVLRLLIRYVEKTDSLDMKRVEAILATLLPELWQNDYMANAEKPVDLEPQTAQQRLHDAIVQVLRAAAEIRPTIIVIEDAQWADEATLALISFLTRISGQTGLQIFITYRDDEVDAEHPLTILDKKRVQYIQLKQFPKQEMVALVCGMLGIEQLPTLLIDQVQQITSGNAFFVQELIRSLAEDGSVFQRTTFGWRINDSALRETQLPESICQVVRRRLAHLSIEVQQMLRLASIVGEIFWSGVLEELGQFTDEQVHFALSKGLEHELIIVRENSTIAGEQEYMFVKPAVWEVNYDSLLPSERHNYHKNTAAWLIAHTDAQAGEHLGLIAEHFEKAGQLEQAVTYLHRAGEQAAIQFAHAEAIAYFSRALELTSENELTQRYALLLARKRVYYLQGKREIEFQDLKALQELAQALDDNKRKAEVALQQADYNEAIGDYPAAIEAANVTIRLAQAIQDKNIEATGYLQWGWILFDQGKYEAARKQFNKARKLAQTANMLRIETKSLLGLGSASNYQGDFDKARSYYQQALPIHRMLNDRRGENWVLGIIDSIQGNKVQAMAFFEQALRINREIGDRLYDNCVINSLGVIGRDLGDYEKASEYFEQALHIAREIGDRYSEGMVLSNLSLLFYQIDDIETARKYNQQALLITQEIGSRRFHGHALTTRGHILAKSDLMTEATNTYQQALTLWRELGQHKFAMESLAGLARISLAQGNLTQAHNQVNEILYYLETNTLRYTEESARVYLTCYRILLANQDPRAREVLRKIYYLLQEQAAKIDDQELRKSFLENIAVHREIIQEFQLINK